MKTLIYHHVHMLLIAMSVRNALQVHAPGIDGIGVASGAGWLKRAARRSAIVGAAAVLSIAASSCGFQGGPVSSTSMSSSVCAQDGNGMPQQVYTGPWQAQSPVGINSPGITTCNAKTGVEVIRPVGTDAVTGNAYIKKLAVYSPSLKGDMKYGSSMQLNGMMETNKGCPYWFVQSVAEFNTKTSMLSFYYLVSNYVKYYGMPGASPSVKRACDSEKATQNGKPFDFVGRYSGFSMHYSLPMQLSIVDTASGNSVSFGYYVNGNSVYSSSIDISNVSGIGFYTSGAAPLSGKYACASVPFCSYPEDFSLVFCGYNGSASNADFTALYAKLSMQYQTGDGSNALFNVITPQNNGLSNTSETASGIVLRHTARETVVRTGSNPNPYSFVLRP